MSKPKVLSIIDKSIQSIPLNVKLVLGAEIKPSYLWLETTDRCNSRCQTCFIWHKQPTPKNKLLTLDELSHCLHDPLMSDVKEVLNSGGECTLVNLEEYLKVEHNALPTAKLQLSTNALLPDRLKQAIEYAMNLGIKCIDVGLSIDGIGEAHDNVRGVKGNFEKLEKTISMLKQLENKYPNRISVSMGSTLTETTAKEASNLYAYSKQTKIPFMWHWFNISSFYENNSKTSTVSPIKDVISNYPKKSLYMDMWLQSLLTGKIPHFKCLALKKFLVIRCDGNVVPCLSKWNETIGNIREQPISVIWNSQKAKAERQKIEKCEGCLNSWGVSWSINEEYYPILLDVLKRKVVKVLS